MMQQVMKRIFLSSSVCWLCAGCVGGAAITDAREDRIIIQSHNANHTAVMAEAQRGCSYYGRTAQLVSSTCLDTFCTRKRFAFSCRGEADAGSRRSSPWLGVSVDDFRDHLYADPPGSSEVVVSRVFADGPGRKAGLQVGDIIESFNGTAVSNAAMLVDLKLPVKAGDEVAFGIRRQNQRLNLRVRAE